MLIACSTILGFRLSDNIRKKIRICEELSNVCDEILLDLNFKVTPVLTLFENCVSSGRYAHLDFLSSEDIQTLSEIKSQLSRDENSELAYFLFHLGKTDLKSQKSLVSAFKDYIVRAKLKYIEEYNKNSKIYITFSVFGSVVFSIILL